MTYRYPPKPCAWCGNEWRAAKRASRTCSAKCAAQLREVEHGKTKGASRREYPPELVERIRELYNSRLSQDQVQAIIGPGYKVERIMKRYNIPRRPPGVALTPKSGDLNPGWKGDKAGYSALHFRVERQRGKPQHCTQCGTTDPAKWYEWANLTGNYADVNDYARMCRSCHRTYDGERRRLTGAPTMPKAATS